MALTIRVYFPSKEQQERKPSKPKQTGDPRDDLGADVDIGTDAGGNLTVAIGRKTRAVHNQLSGLICCKSISESGTHRVEDVELVTPHVTRNPHYHNTHKGTGPLEGAEEQ